VKPIALVFLLAVASGLAALYALGGLDTDEARADLRVSWGPEPESVDPAVITGLLESRYCYTLFEGLVTYDRDHLTPIPGAASEIRRSADGKTYTFPLRPEARWSNGRPVTADDFIWSWRRILDCRVKCEYAYMLYYIRGAQPYHLQNLAELLLASFPGKDRKEKLEGLQTALRPGARSQHATRLRDLADPGREPDAEIRKGLAEAADEAGKRKPLRFEDVGVRALPGGALEVALENATPFILDIFGFQTLMPVPREAVERYGDDWIKPGRIVCNGPFVLERWRPHYAIAFRRNPHYHDAKRVRLDRVVSRIVEGGPMGLNYYERGLLDVIDRAVVPQDFLESIQHRPDFFKYEVFGSYFLRFNVTKPPFDDPRVRRAFALAIDKRPVAEALKGGEKPTDRLVPPYPGYRDVQPAGLAFDPAGARRLLDAAYPDRSKLPKIEYLVRGTPKQIDIFNIIRDQLRKHLGVTIDLKNQEWQIYLDSLSNLQFGLALGGWYGDYADPNTFIDMWVTGGGNNRTGWSDPEYDRWLAESLAEQDPAKRFALLARCEKRVLEEACIVAPLYVSIDYYMRKPFVRGLVTTANPMDRFLMRYYEVAR
jgi:oligopeptide transport system substrate-binding protein